MKSAKKSCSKVGPLPSPFSTSHSSVPLTLPADIGLDPGFKTFYKWCKENNVPVIIVSSGMEPIIRAVLETLLPAEDAQTIPIIANDVRYTDPEHTGKTWEIIYRHPESGFGHDKSKAILPYRDLAHKPTLFFCGDGVSGKSTPRLACLDRCPTPLIPDLSAAKHADVLFAKEMANGDSDLMQYCKREAIPFVPFRDL